MNKPILTATALSKTFLPGKEAEVRAVRGVDLAVSQGDILLIMGPSGSGKTTLVTLLGGLARPSEGSVRIAETELTALSERELTRFRRTHIGFVFQSFHLLSSLTALENVVVAYRMSGIPPRESERRAREILGRLGIASRLHALPKQLSGGEKQRVSIARALANEPEVLFADEPTANLDSKTGKDVMHLLCETSCEQGRTVIIVSHDERLRDVAKHLLHMEDGKLTKEERGGHDRWCRHEESALSHA